MWLIWLYLIYQIRRQYIIALQIIWKQKHFYIERFINKRDNNIKTFFKHFFRWQNSVSRPSACYARPNQFPRRHSPLVAQEAKRIAGSLSIRFYLIKYSDKTRLKINVTNIFTNVWWHFFIIYSHCKMCTHSVSNHYQKVNYIDSIASHDIFPWSSSYFCVEFKGHSKIGTSYSNCRYIRNFFTKYHLMTTLWLPLA